MSSLNPVVIRPKNIKARKDPETILVQLMKKQSPLQLSKVDSIRVKLDSGSFDFHRV